MELCAANQWAAICDQYWSANDAKVVCRQLGFINSVQQFSSMCAPYLSLAYVGTALNGSFYGPGSSNLEWINVAGGCAGNETGLLSCRPNPIQANCSSSHFAGVQCSFPCKVLNMYMYISHYVHVCLTDLDSAAGH